MKKTDEPVVTPTAAPLDAPSSQGPSIERAASSALLVPFVYSFLPFSH